MDAQDKRWPNVSAVVGIDVRRLAAVDMHGTKGTRMRARVILGEFLFGAFAGPLLGLATITGAPGAVWKVAGLAMVGIGLNYVPLSAHALSLRRPEALEAELEGVDVTSELRHYTFVQLWVIVPLSFVVFELSRRRAPADA